jgi:hypothetical protein
VEEFQMKLSHRRLIACLCIVALALSGCGQQVAQEAATTNSKEQPSRLEPIDGTDQSRVILTEQAADRLDIHTVDVRQIDVEGAQHTAIPYAAVVYDTEGSAWVYTSPSPLTYVRCALDVESIDGETAILSDGPPVGMPVVTVGAAELYGAEFEFQAD